MALCKVTVNLKADVIPDDAVSQNKRTNPKMLKELEAKIRRMWFSLDALSERRDASSVVPDYVATSHFHALSVDYSKAIAGEELDYIASALVNNIASIKDHLKNWCAKNKQTFDGDNLIDTNLDVALIHDLWNIDKHAELNRPPRSGYLPKIVNLQTLLSLMTGAEEGSFASLSMDPKTGQMVFSQGGGGSQAITISGDVVDEHGVRLGDFGEICEKAIEAWEQTLIKAGVALPPR